MGARKPNFLINLKKFVQDFCFVIVNGRTYIVIFFRETML